MTDNDFVKVFEKLDDIAHRLAVLETELKHGGARAKDHRENMEKLENRLRVLEAWRWMILGGAIVASSLISISVSVATKLVL